jgi:hypothetical protein
MVHINSPPEPPSAVVVAAAEEDAGMAAGAAAGALGGWGRSEEAVPPVGGERLNYLNVRIPFERQKFSISMPSSEWRYTSNSEMLANSSVTSRSGLSISRFVSHCSNLDNTKA